MNTKKITAKIVIMCIISILITGILFTSLSCSKKSSSSSNTTVSIAAVSKIDLTNVKYKKIFNNFVYNYYCENIFQGKTKSSDYSGEIISNNADEILLCAIDQNQSGIKLDKYVKNGSFSEQYSYVFPQDVGDKIIMSCFNVNSINHNLFKLYDAKTKKYTVSAGAFASATDWAAATVIKSVTQTGDEICVIANFYGIKGINKDGTPTPDYSKTLQAMKFTFKVNNGKYLYEKVETI